MYLYISASVARPRFSSWPSSIHCFITFSLRQDSLSLSLLHLSLFPCPHLLSLSHLPLPLPLICQRSIRTFSLQGDQLSLGIVSESYNLVLPGLVSTSQLSYQVATYIHRPKSGKWFSDHYKLYNHLTISMANTVGNTNSMASVADRAVPIALKLKSGSVG